MAINELLDTVSRCYDYSSFYLLEDKLNEIGLTIQSTRGGKMLLCQIVDNTPWMGEPVKDHIPVGFNESIDEEIPQRLLNTILEFIETHIGDPSFVQHTDRSWNDMPKSYGNWDAVPQAQAPIGHSDVVEIIAKNTPNTPIEIVFGDGEPPKAVRIVLENVSDVDEAHLIAEDMLQSPWETLQEEGSVGAVNRVLAQVKSTMKKLKLRPIIECTDAKENSIEVVLPMSVRHQLKMRKDYNFRNLSSVIDLVKEIEERSKYI
jgi:hypothetical protein